MFKSIYKEKFNVLLTLLFFLGGLQFSANIQAQDPVKEWAYTGHIYYVNAVAVDGDGYVYTVSLDEEMHKIDPSGEKVWAYTGHSDFLIDVAANEDGYVYSASADEEVHKINSSGGMEWAYTGHSDLIEAIAVDGNGYVYSASADEEVHKINPSGEKVWSYTGHSDAIRAIEVDQNGYVYSGSRDEEVHKINPSGEMEWAYTGHNDRIEGVAVDEDGYIYTASGNEVHKIDSSGAKDWSYFGHIDWIMDIAVDENGYTYSSSSYGEVHKVNPSGTKVWNYTGHNTEVSGVAVDETGYVYSSSWDFEVHKFFELPLIPPGQKEPLDNSTVPQLAPTFKWKEVAGADKYEIHVLDISDFDDLVIEEKEIEETNFTPEDNLEEETTYYWRVRAIHESGDEGEWSESWRFEIDEDFVNNLSNVNEEDYQLSSYPNPFTNTTKISYHLPEDADVELTVYDITGQKITRLVEDEQTAGEHSVEFDGSDLPEGMYIVHFYTDNYEEQGKMILK